MTDHHLMDIKGVREEQLASRQQQMPAFPFMAIRVVGNGVMIIITRSQFDSQQVFIPLENAIQLCADFIPTLPHGLQQDLIHRIHEANNVNKDITRAIKAVKLERG